MENVEITVKVNGKEVDLSTISTETFENVKKAVEVKEIPIARVASINRLDDRIIIRVNRVAQYKGDWDIIVLNTQTGMVTDMWDVGKDQFNIREYNFVHTL